MSSESANRGYEVEWGDPPEVVRRRGRRPNPLYDAIVGQLQRRPGVFAVVGSFATYGKALNLQQLLQNRGCHVTTRKGASGDVDVYAAWPATLPVGRHEVATVTVTVVWRQLPPKRAGIRQSWEGEYEGEGP